MARVLLTVGMSPFPFDRLVASASALARRHDVFAQTGTSTVAPSCPHAAFVSYDELRRRIDEADVVVTHAGNTVRLVQRTGKVPVAVAREARRGEMVNDHQVVYLRDEERRRRAVAVWDVERMAAVVDHESRAHRRLGPDELPSLRSPDAITECLDALVRPLIADPFASDPYRRSSYAWRQLAGRRGRHLDYGCDDGTFAAVLQRTTDLECDAVDARADAVAAARRLAPWLRSHHVPSRRPLPFASHTFDSASLLDVLEHVWDERAVLAELHRVLVPGGTLVLTVPARHLFSFLDPDDAKLRAPRLHRLVYAARHGRERYARRFEDITDGFRGDLAVERSRHTNYRPGALLARLRDAGFEPVDRAGAHLFWRLFHGPALLSTGRVARVFETAMLVDGRLFTRANLFLTLRRVP